jgi:hypothetical protein
MEKTKNDLEQTIEEKQTQKPLIHNFNKVDTQSLKSAFTPKVMAILVVVIIVGIVSGFLLSGRSSSSTSTAGLGSILSGNSASKGTVVGSNDTSTFKDTAEGILRVGGIDGEGAFHLERSGGDSQNVYLTSAIVDLSKYVGKKIKVWGQTQKAQTAGWLMDVGRIEVL